MPYTISNPPDRIKNLPDRAKKIWISAFNASIDKGEEYANKIAWTAIKKAGYTQNENGEWGRWQ